MLFINKLNKCLDLKYIGHEGTQTLLLVTKLFKTYYFYTQWPQGRQHFRLIQNSLKQIDIEKKTNLVVA